MRFRTLGAMTALATMLAAPVAQASVLDNPYFKVLGVVIVWGASNYNEAGGSAPIASDFVLMTTGTGNAGADIIKGDVYTVVTGTMNPTSDNSAVGAGEGSLMSIVNDDQDVVDGGTLGLLDASDSLSAFKVGAKTDVTLDTDGRESSFFVASNTAFDIFASAALEGTPSGDFSALSLANISWEMSVTTTGTEGPGFGAAAQDPAGGGGGGAVNTIKNLKGIGAGPTKVFDGGQRTAAKRGSISEQSVRFDVAYDLVDDSGNDYDLSMGAGDIEATVTYTIYVP